MSTHKIKNPTFSETDTFSGRMRLLIGNRKATPWAASLGIPSGTRNRMLQGQGTPPTHETLARIMRAENVSVSWLLGADCPPFIVLRTVDDMDTAKAVLAHLEDSEDWKVSVISGGEMFAIVLRQPAEVSAGKQRIPYTAIEVIAGPFGPSTTLTIRQRRSADQIELRRVDESTMRDIYAGQVGTFALLGDATNTGIISPYLQDSQRYDIMDLLKSPTLRVAEERAVYNIADQLREAWPLMLDSEQETLGRMLKPLIENAEKRRIDDHTE